MIGNMPPIISANTVIASAARVTGLRHAGVGQPQNRRDQRARVRDADPENKIDNVEAPEHRPLQTGHAHAVAQLDEPGERAEQITDGIASAIGSMLAPAIPTSGRNRSSRIFA